MIMLLLMYGFCKKLLDDVCVLFTLFSVGDEFIVYIIGEDFVGIGESSYFLLYSRIVIVVLH